MRIGVLTLQGAFAKHLEAFEALGHRPVLVRERSALQGLSHLVIPGGESTTLRHLMRLFELDRAICDLHASGRLRLFGTCAGAILLGKGDGERPERLGLLDVICQRNGFGRQRESFTAPLTWLGDEGVPLRGVFIRAPRFHSLGPTVRAEAWWNAEPVLVRGPSVLLATFHPELTKDLRVHRAFLDEGQESSP